MEYTTVLLMYYLALGPGAGKTETAIATYKYSGLERALQVYSETYPKELRLFVSDSLLISSALINHSITYSWRF